MMNITNIITGEGTNFTIQVGILEGQGWYARTKTGWNKQCITMCDWKPLDVAIDNLMDFLEMEGHSDDEIRRAWNELKPCGRGLNRRWGQMKGGKVFELWRNISAYEHVRFGGAE